jgi:hypothetical protein
VIDAGSPTCLLVLTQVPLELSPAPVVPFAFLKHARLVGVQRPQHPDPRVHQEVSDLRSLNQAMNGRLLFRLVLFGLYRNELPAPRPRGWMLKRGGSGAKRTKEQEQQNFLL